MAISQEEEQARLQGERGDMKTSSCRFPIGQGFVFLPSKGRSCCCFHWGDKESVEGMMRAEWPDLQVWRLLRGRRTDREARGWVSGPVWPRAGARVCCSTRVLSHV